MEARKLEDADESMVRGIAMRLRAQLGLRGDVDDLVSAGFLGLVEARARFDASRGVQFGTFAYYRIRGAMIDHVRKSTTLSRRAYERIRSAETVDRVGEDVAEMRAAEPSSRADAAATVAALEQAVGRLTMAFVASCVGQDEEPVDPETALESREAETRVRRAIETLPDRERAIVVGHYLEGKRFDAIADELGVSKSWTSRMHTKALDRLRQALDD